MKTPILKLRDCGRFVRLVKISAVMALLGGVAAVAQAQPKSPVGTWDCVMSGPRQGVAYITFSDGPPASFSGYEVIVPNGAVQADTYGRNAGGDVGRNDRGNGTNTTGIQIVGYESPSGPWGFDNQGHLIGEFIEVSYPSSCVTNYVPISTNFFIAQFPITSSNVFVDSYCVTQPLLAATNATSFTNQTVCYSKEVDCTRLTNQFSFKGTVTPGKRLTLVCATPFGHVTYRGVPAVTLPDISGSYYAIKKLNNQTFLEFFELINAGGNGYVISGGGPVVSSESPYPTGQGPGYFFPGSALLSSQHQLALTANIFIDTNHVDPHGEIFRAAIGRFNSNKDTATLRGWEEPLVGTSAQDQSTRLTLQITKQQ
jgi:hypothetical protein